MVFERNAADEEGPLTHILEDLAVSSAKGPYPQIRTQQMPEPVSYGELRQRLQQADSFTYGAVNINLATKPAVFENVTLPRSLDDTQLMDCLGESLAAYWVKKLWWIQVFMGGAGTGMVGRDV